MRSFALSLFAAVLLAAPAPAKPITIALPEPAETLKPGDGQELAEGNCAACHSLDYIATQPPGKGAPFWDAEVKKMIEVYGAPISSDDAKTISAYLAKSY